MKTRKKVGTTSAAALFHRSKPPFTFIYYNFAAAAPEQ